MEELFEYMVPLQGLFKKKRDPKIIESYKQLSDFNEITEDFKLAKIYLNDAVRIGNKCIFCKEKVTIFYLSDVVKAEFRLHGYDATDEYGTINLIFRDGSSTAIYKTYETDEQKVAKDVIAAIMGK